MLVTLERIVSGLKYRPWIIFGMVLVKKNMLKLGKEIPISANLIPKIISTTANLMTTTAKDKYSHQKMGTGWLHVNINP